VSRRSGSPPHLQLLRAVAFLTLLSLILPLSPRNLIAQVRSGATGSAGEDRTSILVRYRHQEREVDALTGNWIPAEADIFVAVSSPLEGSVRAFRMEVFAIQKGERVMIEVPGLQEWEKQTRKWVHADLSADQAGEGRWIWGGTFRPGDQIVLQWRDADSGRVIPHPITLRMVESFGAKLAFATPVSLVFPVTGEATVTASAGFSVRYYRTSNAPLWRTLNRIGFPSVAFAYATVGGRKSVLYSIGISAIQDQIHLYYGGYRNSLSNNNFWMVGLSLKTSDLMAAARRAIK
jgi:hypothetical protein